jgi:zona occludens toxin (predicted ATPase)
MISQWLSTASAPEPEAAKPAATPLDVQIIEHPMAERFVSVLLGKLNKEKISDTTTKEQERILAYLNKQQEEAK